jgi:hypothetical protein
VARILIVTGLGPHENAIVPPARTAATTAEEVQLRAVPCPTTRVGAAHAQAGPAPDTSALTHATRTARRRNIAAILLLIHEYPRDYCGWLPDAGYLSRHGVRVLLFGTASDWSPLAATVAAFIRRHAGVHREA